MTCGTIPASGLGFGMNWIINPNSLGGKSSKRRQAGSHALVRR
jgi:hypothetical protein